MCLILLAWQVHPGYPLVVAANRDEFFSRPTAPAAFWSDSPDFLAGRDLDAGGTWMGIGRDGRFAALTNFRDPSSHRSDALSRGLLVADFLRTRIAPHEFLASLAASAERYNGFNLVVGDGTDLCWHSNVERRTERLVPGIYGLSNHLLNTPWPKVVAAKSALSAALVPVPDDDALFRLLRDDQRHNDEALPRTGVSIEWERLLSAAFVKAPGYGTRSSTVLRIDEDGWVVFDEQTWLPNAAHGGRKRYRFRQVPAS